MKRILPIFSIAVIMAACNNNPDTISALNPAATIQQAPSINSDTVGFAQFQNLKAQNELAPVEEPKQAVQYVAAAPVRKRSVPVHKVSKSVVTAPKSRTSIPQSSGSTVSSSEESGNMSTESAEVAKAPAKKGWSKTAKGAVIGGASGAIAGAVLNKKNRAVGAVIGGVIGAAGGAVIGRGMDKKDGRFIIE